MPFATDDTIVAVATPRGRGGIGVVRVAGPEAVRIAGELTGRTDTPIARHASFARVIDPARVRSSVVDHVVVTWFAAPNSYTGDDVVEISGHGSPVLLDRIVALAMMLGARLAEPGEFTLRAYLNGKLDLVQAEAVADLVDAVTPLQARAAMDQLEGTLTGAIARIDHGLLDLSARLEASLDFPDEGFHFVTREAVGASVDRWQGELHVLAATGRTGRVIREGRTVVLAGRPNAGKSSLFNALAGAARAIVAPAPGTTRDVLTESVDIGGLAVTIVDTAGLRESTDDVEREGVSRARQAQRIAALTIVVVDGSIPAGVADREMVESIHGPTIVVASKSDKPQMWTADAVGMTDDHVARVSAITGEGLDALRARIVTMLTGREDVRDAPAISNMRHLQLVDEASAALGRARAALDAGATEELVVVDVVAARRSLEAITGVRTADDVLHDIFARFCIGK